MTSAAEQTLQRLYAADAEQRAANLPPSQRTRNVDRDTGHFLRLLATSIGAQRVLEIGSSNGVSTIWLALAVEQARGEMIGTEILPARAAEANVNLTNAGLNHVARVEAGDARSIVARLQGPFDLVFIDAEKDDYITHFAAVIDLVGPRGLVLADNVLSHDLSAYQEVLRQRVDVETVTVPIGRGLEYTLKR
ncbi:MAG: DUF1442 domain-containing protein [Chloroflexota bacterium]|nr:DUF1442 domain-containing protein [Chloroflexota bacterium]